MNHQVNHSSKKQAWRYFIFLTLSFVFFSSLPFFVEAQAFEEITCPTNSHLSGEQCLCNTGYVAQGDTCVSKVSICRPYGPSHLVGEDCVCNDGYAVIDGSGKCLSLSATCAKYNAIWSAVANNCVCRDGFHEDTSSNKCVADGPTPAELEAQKQAQLAAQQKAAQEQAAKAKTEQLRQEPLKKQAETEKTKTVTPVETVEEAPTPIPEEGKKFLEDTNPEDPIVKGAPQKPETKPVAAPPANKPQKTEPLKEVASPKPVEKSSDDEYFDFFEDTWDSSNPDNPIIKGGQLKSGDQKAKPNASEEKALVTQAMNNVRDIIYQKSDPVTKAVIEQNKSQVTTLAQKKFEPSADVLANLPVDEETHDPVPLMKFAIEESFDFLTPEKEAVSQKQLETVSLLGNFKNDETEVLLNKKSATQIIQDEYVAEEYETDTIEWNKEVKKAVTSLKTKSSVDKENFKMHLDMEQKLKTEIATLEKILGFNHMRCGEATNKAQHLLFKFDHQSQEYKNYFNNKPAENAFDDTAEAVAFNHAAKNIIGINKQIQDLKTQYKQRYPKGWKLDYLDVRPKPTYESKVKESENIFMVFEKLRNKE